MWLLWKLTNSHYFFVGSLSYLILETNTSHPRLPLNNTSSIFANVYTQSRHHKIIFSAIRAGDGWNYNLTAGQLEAFYKRSLVRHEVKIS